MLSGMLSVPQFEMERGEAMVNRMRKAWPLYLMLIPGIVLVFIFSYIPLYGVVIAFQKYNPRMLFNSPWIGFDNFTYVFQMPGFMRTIWNTFYISVLKIILGIIVPVTFSLMLNEIQNKYFKRTFQTIVYLPHFISWVIMAGILTDLLSLSGIVNQIIGFLGMEPILFLGNNDTFPATLVISDVWKSFGYGTIIYLAALTNIDPNLYEAAMVDGANRWKQTIHITLPGIIPIITLMTVLSLGNVLNAGFDQVFNLYSPIVYESGDIIDTFVYRLGLEQLQYSPAAAVGLFKSAVSCVLVGLGYFLADRCANYRVF